jgi:hypothetical protein
MDTSLAFERASLGQHLPGRPARVCGDRFQCVGSVWCSDVGDAPQHRLVHRTQTPLAASDQGEAERSDYGEGAQGVAGCAVRRTGTGPVVAAHAPSTTAPSAHSHAVIVCSWSGQGALIKAATHDAHTGADSQGPARLMEVSHVMFSNSHQGRDVSVRSTPGVLFSGPSACSGAHRTQAGTSASSAPCSAAPVRRLPHWPVIPAARLWHSWFSPTEARQRPRV